MTKQNNRVCDFFDFNNLCTRKKEYANKEIQTDNIYCKTKTNVIDNDIVENDDDYSFIDKIFYYRLFF